MELIHLDRRPEYYFGRTRCSTRELLESHYDLASIGCIAADDCTDVRGGLQVTDSFQTKVSTLGRPRSRNTGKIPGCLLFVSKFCQVDFRFFHDYNRSLQPERSPRALGQQHRSLRIKKVIKAENGNQSPHNRIAVG